MSTRTQSILLYVLGSMLVVVSHGLQQVTTITQGIQLGIAAVMVGGLAYAGILHASNPDIPLPPPLQSGIEKLGESKTHVFFSQKKAVALLLLFSILSMGCAQTKFYKAGANGKPQVVASFQADMQNQSFTYQEGKTKITWNCLTVSHSSATLAQGQAADTVLGGVATTVTATGIAVATSGMFPGGIAAIIHKVF